MFEIIILILFICLVSNSAIYVSRKLHHVAIKNSVKQLVFFLKLVRENTIIKGLSIVLLIDYIKSELVCGNQKNQNNFLFKLPKDYKIVANIGNYQTSFGKQIKFYPDGHISAGSLYLTYKNLVYKLTISVQQIPIFTAYFLNNGVWQKIII